MIRRASCVVLWMAFVLAQGACGDGSARAPAQGQETAGQGAAGSATKLAKAGEVCGGLEGVACEGKLWCDTDADSCDTNDATGHCAAVPDVCTTDYTPVCGCDAKTYPNDCARQKAKAYKRADGECKA